MNRQWLAASILSASCFVGCHREHEGPPPQVVIVEPGYYYDAEYRGVDGRDHPRAYYYYDGHQYVPHETPPPNVVIHERVHVEDRDGRHDNHPGDFHEGDRDVPGEQLHGGEVNHDDRPGQLGPRDR